jgi:phosphatidate phosphatase APP1
MTSSATGTIGHRLHRFLVATAILLTATTSGISAAEYSGWSDEVGDVLQSTAASIEEYSDMRWRQFADRMGFGEPRHIAAYRGYGNAETLWLRGRLLSNERYGGPEEDDSWWDNLKASYQRWDSDEVAGAKIRLSYVDQQKEVVTDSEGYYYAEFAVDENFPRTATVLAEHRLEDEVLHARHRILLPDPTARYVVISDVDDTVIHTGLTDLLTAARLTFLNNAKTRKPLRGVAALYRALAAGDAGGSVNPVIYVSNSAWNMYDLLRDFMELNDLPRGPLLLRDLGIGADTSDHKIETITRVTRRYAPLPVVLIGDSGQHDAEIYAEVAKRFPDRVKAIYIRDVDPRKDSEHDEMVDQIIEGHRSRDTAFLRVGDSGQIARHLAEMGILDESVVNRVERAVEADAKRETLEE